MTAYFLQPSDVWLFRDGRPFNAAGDHRAESVFPPFPSVVQGAYRTYHLSLQDNLNYNDKDAVRALVGDAETYPLGFSIRGPFIGRLENGRLVRYFPQPADALTLDPTSHTLRCLAPGQTPRNVLTNAPTPFLIGLDEPLSKGETNLWLSETALHDYLRGKRVQAIPAAELFSGQEYPGVALDTDRRASVDGALFEVEYTTVTPQTGLYVEVEGLPGWPDTGCLRLGGENRVTFFAATAPLPWPAAPDPLPSRFKVYFASPAYFPQGWKPGRWEQFFEGQVELVAAAIHRVQIVGGYDMARNDHKAAERYVPAGSVYYFSARGMARMKPEAQGRLTDRGQQIGFGQVIIKGW